MDFLNVVIWIIVLGSSNVDSEPPGYLTFAQIESELANLASDNPQRTHLYSIGKSVGGRNLWVMAIANQHPDQHVLLRPEIKFIGGMHGNELTPVDVLMRYIKELLTNPNNDVRIDEILNTTRVHVLVHLNPDPSQFVLEDNCTSHLGNNNTNNYDLNLNFPDKFFCQRDPMQPETLAIIEWLESQRFFTGGIVTTYPYENFPGSEFATKPRESLTEDDDVFKFLSKKYSLNHKEMPLTSTICDGNKWKDGIINGAAWWPPIRGGMEDINYWRYGCYEVTMEIGCCLLPPASELPQIWEDNKNALIEFTRAANTGIRGIVNYLNGQPARYLSVRFNAREPIFKTTDLGEFFAFLLPGVYNLTLLLNCDAVYSTMIRIHHLPPIAVLNITLDDEIYFRAFYYNLNKYALFCTKSKAPVDCSTGFESNTSTTSSAIASFSIHTPVSLLAFIIYIFSTIYNFI